MNEVLRTAFFLIAYMSPALDAFNYSRISAFFQCIYFSRISISISSQIIVVEIEMFSVLCISRYLRSALPRLRITGYGWGTRAEPGITICTRSSVTQPWMALLNKCTLRWLLVTGCATTASKSSRQPPFPQNSARGRAPSNSTTPRSSSRWCWRRWGHHPGSSRPHTRRLGPTSLCNLFGLILSRYQFPCSAILDLFKWKILSGEEKGD